MKPLVDYLKKYYFFDENSEPNKFIFEDDVVEAVRFWLNDFIIENQGWTDVKNVAKELRSYLVAAKPQ